MSRLKTLKACPILPAWAQEHRKKKLITSKSVFTASQFNKNVCNKNVDWKLRKSQPGSEILRSSKHEFTVFTVHCDNIGFLFV